MRITLFFLFVLSFHLIANNTNAQDAIVEIKNTHVSVRQLIQEIEKQTDYLVVYSNREVNTSREVSLRKKADKVSSYLNEAFAGTDIGYDFENNYIVLSKKTADANAKETTGAAKVFQQTSKAVTGKVVDSNGEPVIGATVIERGNASNGTITDVDGNFSLRVAPDAILEISYIGYQNLNIPTQGLTTLNVVLKEDSKLLDEVVVVGYGTQKKVNLTGAVASVDTKALQSRPVASAVAALQGVVPGLNISVSNHGNRLDANPSMNIRGSGGLATSGASSSPLVLIDGVEGSLNNINPQDIANISVLKDAASASIYGSRAPFGVVLVTTKSGEKGKVTTTYSNSFRWTRPTNIPDMLDSYRFAQYFNVGQANAGRTNPIFPEDVMERIKKYMAGEIKETANPNESQGPNAFPFNLRSNDNQNWPRNFIDKTSFAQEHNIGISGGGDKMRYYVSGAFLTQDGQLNFAKERKNRYNVSGKITADVTPWLSIDFNSRFIREDITMPSFLKAYGDRFFPETTKLYPMMPLYDNNGHYTRNPKLMQLDYGGRSNQQSNTYFTQGGFTLNPIKGMGIYGQAALRTISDQLGYAINKVYLYTRDNQPVEEAWLGGDPDLAAGKTSFESRTNQSSLITASLHADYEFAFGLNNFKAMLGMNSEAYITNGLMGKRFDLIDENVPSINTSTGISTNSGGQNHWATMGYFGRLNYDYDGKYLVEFNLRRDGTSRFRGDKRWGVFPSFSLGWNVAREDFWQPLEQYVNTFKPRFSYGTLGNQNTVDRWGNPVYHPSYAFQGITVGTPDTGGRWILDPSKKSNVASSPGLISALLTWERITSYNYGVDFGALNNRLTGYFDYFVRNTDDMVGPAEELPPIVGAKAPDTNNTSIQAKGWELQVSWRDRVGDFGYNATFNLSDSRTWVTKFPNPAKNLTYKDPDDNIRDYYWVGKELGQIWGYTTLGMAKTDEEMAAHLAAHNQDRLAQGQKFWKAGDIMYKNLDDNPEINNGENTVDKPGDLRVIGNSTPRFRFGLSLGADYKGFDLSLLFQGVAKRDYWVDGMIFWGINGGQWSSTGYEEHWNFFRPEGDPLGANLNAYFPRPIFDNRQNQHKQTGYLQNASYIRLKNMQVGYTLPRELTKRISVEKARVFLSGDNLWTGTKISKNFDPELLYQNGMTYPLASTLSCGLSITL